MEGADIGAALRSIILPIVKDAIGEAVAELRPKNEDKPLTRAQLAEWLQVSPRQVDNLRSKGMPFLLLGDSPRFEKAKVLAWMQERAK